MKFHEHDLSGIDVDAVTELLADIGVALAHIQLAETVIRKTLHFVLPERPIKNLKGFMRAENALTKGTLGTLAKKLRERADLHPRFDLVMTRFVEDRNTLVHHLDEVPGFTTRTAEGQATARAWMAELVRTTDTVVKVFTALMIAYTEQIASRPMAPDEVREYVGDDLIVAVDMLFRKKADT